MPFYAVAKGKNPGVYNTWPECESQVKGFKYAKYRKFNTLNEANEFCQMYGKESGSSSKVQENYTVDQPKFIGSIQSVKRKLPSDESTGPLPTKRATHSRFNWVPYGTRGDYSDTVIVYTDGACTGNGTKRAKAGIGVYWGDGHSDNVSEPLKGKQTNNRAEIQAVVRAVQQAKNNGYKSLTVRTDSQFLLDSMTKWIDKWIKNNWKLSTGEPVKNKDDFIALLESMKSIEIIWEKVPAHSNVKGNEMADRLAVEGAKKSIY